MKKTIITFSVLSVILLASSCKKGDTGPAGATGATGATGPNLSGNMEGFVSLFDVAGSRILGNLKGDTVTLTNNSNNTVVKTVTDSTGKYVFSNLTTGNYNLTTAKAGYGTLLAQDIQFVGGGNTYKNGALSQIPTINISGAVAVDTTITTAGAGNLPENYVKVRGYIPATASGSEVIIFVSNVGAMNPSNNVSNYSANYTLAVTPGATSFKVNIPTSDLHDLGFSTGATVYFAVYVIGGNLNASSYSDLSTGRTVYTAVSSSPVIASALVQ